MPKVVYTAKKGLHQVRGSGFEVGDVAVLEPIQSLTDANGTAITPHGTTVLTLTAGANVSAIASGAPAGTKKVITCAARTGGSHRIDFTVNGVQDDGATALASITFDAADETAVLVSNGTKWICIKAAGATEAAP